MLELIGLVLVFYYLPLGAALGVLALYLVIQFNK